MQTQKLKQKTIISRNLEDFDKQCNEFREHNNVNFSTFCFQVVQDGMQLNYVYSMVMYYEDKNDNKFN